VIRPQGPSPARLHLASCQRVLVTYHAPLTECFNAGRSWYLRGVRRVRLGYLSRHCDQVTGLPKVLRAEEGTGSPDEINIFIARKTASRANPRAWARICSPWPEP
jgi:hypothetical protein